VLEQALVVGDQKHALLRRAHDPVDPLADDPQSCIVLYAGLHGLAQGLEHVLDAAARLRDERLSFAFVGDGPKKAELVARPDRDPAGAGWRWMPELLQNREYRYYAWLSLFALVIGLSWSQLRRYGVFGWAVRSRLGLRGPVRMIAAPFGWLTRLRLPGLRSK